MESTGIYWIPAFEILEQHGFDVILVNARYAKNVPGRKTDVSDAGWLRQLHSYGLLRGRFRPEAEIANLRAYMRQRERLGEDVTEELEYVPNRFIVNRIVRPRPACSGCEAFAQAPLAQAEREAISRRTREALAVAKALGMKLGNPNGAAALRRAGKGGTALRATVSRNAEAHARDLAPVLQELRTQGVVSLRGIAAALNARGMLTRRGGRWHVSNVGNLLRRLDLVGQAAVAN